MKITKSCIFKIPVYIFLAILLIYGLRQSLLPGPLIINPDSKIFSLETKNLPLAKSSETIELKDGDALNLSAEIIKKEINGNMVKMLGYNGQIPGPLIKIPQNAKITINLTNNTDVASTIHSHGVRLENKFDGTHDLTQKLIQPGESFIYKLDFPDPGIYWYHPHFRADYAQELGLYGNFLVTPRDPQYWNPVDREIPLFLDDILIENGQIAPFKQNSTNHALMGRFGNTMLLNGEVQPTINLETGETVRFYLTNSANVRPFNISIFETKLKLVGADNGKYQNETFLKNALINPSERVILEAQFLQSGEYKMIHQTPEKTYTLGKIKVTDNSTTKKTPKNFENLRLDEDILGNLNLENYLEKPAAKKLLLTLEMMGMMGENIMNESMGGHGMMMNGNEKIEWEDAMPSMNLSALSKNTTWKIVDQETKKANLKINNWQFKKGDFIKIEIDNTKKSMHPMQHPIHIHGQRFLVLKTNGIKNENLVWKDTATVQTGDEVEFLVEMSNPGKWMIHCHIAEHLESGMMMQFTVK